MIHFACPSCGKSLNEPETSSGTKIYCSNSACGQKIRVPEQDTSKTMGGVLLPNHLGEPKRLGEWYYEQNGEQNGPVTMADLKHLARNGNLMPGTPVWTEGMSDWQAAGKRVPTLFASAPVNRAKNNPASNEEESSATSRWEAIGFGFFALIAAAILVVLAIVLIPKLTGKKEDVASKKEESGGKDDAPESGKNAQVKKPFTAVDISANFEKSVAVISWHNGTHLGSGTGFIIAPGVVATNHHVIQPAKMNEFEVTFPSSNNDEATKPLKARLLYEDAKRDLAFLKVTTFDLPPLKLATGKSAKGSDVFCIGTPGSGKGRSRSVNQVNPGTLTNPNVFEDDQQLTFHIISANINHGNSGGPVLDTKGEVIGVVVQISYDDNGQRLEGINKAIPSQAVQDALLTIRNKTSSDMDKIEQKHNLVADLVKQRMNKGN